MGLFNVIMEHLGFNEPIEEDEDWQEGLETIGGTMAKKEEKQVDAAQIDKAEPDNEDTENDALAEGEEEEKPKKEKPEDLPIRKKELSVYEIGEILGVKDVGKFESEFNEDIYKWKDKAEELFHIRLNALETHMQSLRIFADTEDGEEETLYARAKRCGRQLDAFNHLRLATDKEGITKWKQETRKMGQDATALANLSEEHEMIFTDYANTLNAYRCALRFYAQKCEDDLKVVQADAKNWAKLKPILPTLQDIANSYEGG